MVHRVGWGAVGGGGATVRMPLNVFSMIWISEQHIKCLTSPRFVKLN